MRLALIDADILVYEAAYRAQESIEWSPGEFTHGASLPAAMADFKGRVDSIMEDTGCEEQILVLTTSDRETNFRRSIWPTYKANRDDTLKPSAGRPLLYAALRQWVRDEYRWKTKEGMEGDDALGIMATGDIKGFPDVENRVLCSVDKDLLTIPGWHFNWRKRELGIVYVPETQANYNHMMQTLTGDPTDGYPGLPGMGPKRAAKLLEGVYDPRTRWELVVGAYQSKGFTEGDALVQARCARILQACDWDFDNEQVILWTPPGE